MAHCVIKLVVIVVRRSLRSAPEKVGAKLGLWAAFRSISSLYNTGPGSGRLSKVKVVVIVVGGSLRSAPERVGHFLVKLGLRVVVLAALLHWTT